MGVNCWEHFGCGRGPEGDRSCPAGLTSIQGAPPNGGRAGGRACWAVAGTFCGGEVRGSAASKLLSCADCAFMHQVRAEEGEAFEGGSALLVGGEDPRQLGHAFDQLLEALAELRRSTDELLHARMMASTGTLAAGVAHEINTPLQYLGDNLGFLREAFVELTGLLALYRDGLTALPENELCRDLLERVAARETEAGLPFLLEHAGSAFDGSFRGLHRVTETVAALREFAREGHGTPEPTDLNRALRTTVTVARSRWEGLVELDLQEAELPPVVCEAGAVHQALLALLLNAIQAAQERLGGGRVSLRTSVEGPWARVEVEDNGPGIPEAVQARMFEPFFSTREVGVGSGTGLATAHAVVVVRHGGRIEWECGPERGTRFVVSLPISGTAPGDCGPRAER